MTDRLRITCEIGPKRRVVAGALDWPGLDRWGRSEAAALETLTGYLPRYADVARRAGLADAFERVAGAPSIEVVDRHPGSSTTDFWGIVHFPSQVEHAPIPAAELERRLSLLRAGWSYFDDVAGRVSAELARGPRGGGRTRDQIVVHVYASERHNWWRKVGLRLSDEPLLAPDEPGGVSGRLRRPHSRLPRRGEAGPDLAARVPHPPDRPARDGPRLGAGGQGPQPSLTRRDVRGAPTSRGTSAEGRLRSSSGGRVSVNDAAQRARGCTRRP